MDRPPASDVPPPDLPELPPPLPTAPGAPPPPAEAPPLVPAPTLPPPPLTDPEDEVPADPRLPWVTAVPLVVTGLVSQVLSAVPFLAGVASVGWLSMLPVMLPQVLGYAGLSAWCWVAADRWLVRWVRPWRWAAALVAPPVLTIPLWIPRFATGGSAVGMPVTAVYIGADVATAFVVGVLVARAAGDGGPRHALRLIGAAGGLFLVRGLVMRGMWTTLTSITLYAGIDLMLWTGVSSLAKGLGIGASLAIGLAIARKRAGAA